MPDSNVNIVLTAQDQASAEIQKLITSYESLTQWETRHAAEAKAATAAENAAKTATNELADANTKAAGATTSLFTSFTAASLAANAITAAYHDVVGIFQDSIKAATGAQLALSGLASTAAAFGGSAATATAAAKNLTSDGLLTLTDSATALKNLLSSGLNLDQATQLMDIYKDRAAFGRQNTISYGAAVQNLAESFKTQSSMIGNLSGMTENYNQIIATGAAEMGKSVSSLSLADTAQAKYLGTLALSNGSLGDAARYAETYAGEQARLATATQNAQIALGQGLQPAVESLQKGFVSLLTGGMAATNDNLPILQGNFLALATGVRVAMDAIVGFGSLAIATFQAVISRSMTPLDDAWNGVKNTFSQTFSDMDAGFAKIASGATTATDITTRAVQDQAVAVTKAAKQMNEALASENSSFAEAQAARVQTFDESLQKMVTDHQTKVTTIKQQLADETASYLDAAQRRDEAYNGQVSSAEDAHAQKVADITQQISDEKQRGLVVDGVLYQEADQKKLDKLQQSLDKENASYTTQLTKLKTTYDNQVAVAQAAEDKKVKALQTSLSQQEKILQAHAAEVTKYGNQQALDDISTLERKYAQEDAKASDHHNDALAKIKQRAYDQGMAGGAGSVRGLADGVRAATPSLTDATKKLTDAVHSASLSGQGSVNNPNSLAGQRARAAGGSSFLGDIDQATGAISGANALLNLPVTVMSYLSKTLFGFAEGGTITRPTILSDAATGIPYAQMAENGPENIVPLHKMGGSNSPTVHIQNATFANDIDLSAFARELAWRIS